MKKFIRILLICMIVVMSTTISVFAEEDDSSQQSECFAYIISEYSSDITPQEGDIFEITYRLKDGSNLAKITFDASIINNKKAEIPLPDGVYEIVMIEYKGKNSAIKSYAIISKFNSTSSEKTRSTVIVGVGKEKADSIKSKYQMVEYVDLNSPDWYNMPSDNAQETTQSQETYQTPTDTYTEDENYSDDYGVEEQKPTGEDPKIEVYSTTEENKTEEVKDNKNNNKIFIIIIVIVILAIVIFKFGSKPKSRR